jgi:hypothetical protein
MYVILIAFKALASELAIPFFETSAKNAVNTDDPFNSVTLMLMERATKKSGSMKVLQNTQDLL